MLWMLVVFFDSVRPSFDPVYRLQIFASHAIGGITGNILTALFAQASVAGFDGFTVIPGGWLDHHYVQLGYQVADSLAGLSYSFVMTVSCISPSLSSHFLINHVDYHPVDHALHPRPRAPCNGGG
jgi:ammonia channel protein AmtB